MRKEDFFKADQVTFNDGTVIISPKLKGGLQIGATYQRYECYNIWGWHVNDCWKKVS